MFIQNLKQLLVMFALALGTLSSSQCVLGQFDGFNVGGSFGNSGRQSPISAEGVIVAPSGDQPAILVVTAYMEDGYKTYSITQPPGGPVQTQLKIDRSDQYTVGDFSPVDEPKMHLEEVFDNLPVEEYYGSATWYAPIKLADGVSLDELQIKGKVFAQACNANGCLPPRDHPFVAKLGKSPVPLPSVQPLASSPPEVDATPNRNMAPNSPPDGTSDVANDVEVDQGQAPPGLGGTDQTTQSINYDIHQLSPKSKSSSSTSLPLMIGAAMLAGFILNFMPCVLPVIGLKLLSFLEQGGNNPRRVLMLNVWYSLGIISVFWALAGISIVLRRSFNKSFGWGEQFSYDGFNIALVSIVFVMALSFLGVWEIPIPGFASGKGAQNMARKEGAIGAFIKGMITTLLATPCSGPFLGTAVGFALISPPVITMLIFTFMGLGMASPYLLVGFKPSLMRFLPKPGAWMDTFKQLMGFVLIGTVLWLMLPIDPPLLMPTLVLLAGLAFACWWIGRTPGYAESSEKVMAWVKGGAVAAVIGWLAFAAPQVTDPLPWRRFTMSEFVEDVNSNKTVMVEFTAQWCATCKALKAANLDRSKTKSTITKNNVVVYEVDIDHISDVERQFFETMQPSQGVPLIAIFPAGDKYSPILFGDGYRQSQILEALDSAGPSRTN